MKKTNAMRMLDEAKIHYEVEEYDVDPEDLSGLHVAQTASGCFGVRTRGSN